MVAFSITRRSPQDVTCPQPGFNRATARRRGSPPHEPPPKLSPRDGHMEVCHTPDGAIVHVRIGRWRTVSAGVQRRIAEVRQLACDRIAVKIHRCADGGERASSEIWQLYDREGRLEAALQTSTDGKLAVLTNYQSREASRLVRDQRNELVTVETWRI